ncbi:hypothetical protein B0H14DRAFT_3883328, partial [Mycena olivaceomarginata]
MLLRFLVISAKFSVPDDKTVLASLACDIRRRPTLLADLCARECTATALVTLYPGGSLIARAESAASFCWPDSDSIHSPDRVNMVCTRKGNTEGESLFSHNGLMPEVVGADAREYLLSVFVCAAFCFLCPFVHSYPRSTIPHRSFLLPPCSPHRILPSLLQLSTRLLNPQNTPAPNATTSTPPRLLASSVVSPSWNRAPGPGLPPPSPLPVSPLSTMSFAPPSPTPSKSTPSAVRQRSALARGGSDD